MGANPIKHSASHGPHFADSCIIFTTASLFEKCLLSLLKQQQQHRFINSSLPPARRSGLIPISIITSLTMERSPTKQTPRKRSRRQSDSDGDFVLEEESPTKKAKAPATPSKAAQRQAEIAHRKQWKLDWERWIVCSQWKDDPQQPYEQKVNTFEIHKSDGEPARQLSTYYHVLTIFIAMSYYNLSQQEMGTLPHWEFRNDYNPLTPGRSYSHEGVKMLVARKHAML